jgi:nucleoside 2-deoxyribosyltransferase
MNKRIVAYLAVPYSLVNKSREIGIHKTDTSEKDKKIRQERFEKVNAVADKLQQAGFAVISPISQSHVIAIQCNLKGTFDYWQDIDYNLILRCDMVIILTLDGWKESEGVQKEIAFAKQNNIPVLYIDEEVRIING